MTKLLPEAEAAEIIRRGGIVAFPTETVYGLGANALDAAAIARIFAAKGRPADNPVIVHIAEASAVKEVARNVPDIFYALAERFWPGPLTFVLRRRDDVPPIVSAGLGTIAVRAPNHPVAITLIKAAGVPIAAPSANRSGRPSATRAEHVIADFRDSIDGVVDGGPTSGGIESTVIDLTGEFVRILRPGAVTAELLKELLGYLPQLERNSHASPGTRHRHYRPSAEVRLFSGSLPHDPEGAFLTLTMVPPESRFSKKTSSLDEMAATLYDFFRESDLLGVKAIYVEAPPNQGLGAALLDRLARASEK